MKKLLTTLYAIYILAFGEKAKPVNSDSKDDDCEGSCGCCGCCNCH